MKYKKQPQDCVAVSDIIGTKDTPSAISRETNSMQNLELSKTEKQKYKTPVCTGQGGIFMGIFDSDPNESEGKNFGDRSSFRAPDTAIVMLSYISGCAIAAIKLDFGVETLLEAFVNFIGITLLGSLFGLVIFIVMNAFCYTRGHYMTIAGKILFFLAVPASLVALIHFL